MLFEPRIGLKPLAALCRRLALSLGAGVDVRTVWLRETNSARGPGRRRFSEVSDAVAAGGSMSDGLKQTGGYFPLLFRELVQVGEMTGHLPEVFRQLADNYEHQLKLRRAFVSSLTWPLIELTLALSVVGLVIWLMGAIPTLAKNKTDLFGLGLTGTTGLITYLTFLAMVAGAGFFVYQAMVRGLLWVAPLQVAIMKVPKLGGTLETLAMARLSWAMHVTLNSGMDLRPAMKMSLQSTHNALYTRHIDRVLADIRQGREIHEALSATRVFPIHFIDAVQVGEQSGQLVESMQNLSGQYQDEARVAMNTLTVLLGVAVMALIAGIIIFFIFRVFGFYLNSINDALNMKH
jgi:type II secretory pathway component PulF